MAATDLREREAQAGGDAGDIDYDARFNELAGQLSQDEFDAIIARNYGGSHSDTAVDAHGDTVKRNWNADDPEDNGDAVRDLEAKSGQAPTSALSSTRSSRFIKGIRKYGPTGGIVALLLGGFGGMGILLLPGSLLMALTDALTNDGSDSARTNIVMRRAYIGSLIGKGNCDTKIKCKMTTMSDAQKKTWEKQGFKIEATTIDNNGSEKGNYSTDGSDQNKTTGERYKVTKVTFPDGTPAASGSEFHKYADSNPEGRRLANRVLNNRSSFFQNAKFTKVLGLFDIKKSKVLKSSADPDKETRTKAVADSFDENTKSSADHEERKGIAQKKIRELIARAHAKSKKNVTNTDGEVHEPVDSGKPNGPKKLKGTGAADMLSTMCMAYNMVRAANAGVKAYWIYQLVNFGFPFIQAGAQIKYYGHITPEVSEAINDRLTWYAKEENLPDDRKEEAGLTAMDAQGIRQALYGDSDALRQVAKDYSTGAPLIATSQATQKIIDSVQGMVGGKENLHTLCAAANAASWLGLAQCLNPAGAVVCAAGLAIVALVGDDLLEWVMKEVTEDAIEYIAKADLSSNLKGVRAGEALAAGVGLMLSRSSMGNGLKPTKNIDQIRKFITATEEVHYKYGEELARLEARDTPWDIYNQYSFTGQLARTLNPYVIRDRSIYGVAANTFSAVTRPLLGYTTPASALYSMPSNMTLSEEMTKNRIGKCNEEIDKEMIELGYACDTTGRMVGHTNMQVLADARTQATGEGTMIVDTLDYMVEHEYIDEDGKPREKTDKNSAGKAGDDETEDNQYLRYKNYCTEDRMAPLGMQFEPIEEGTETDQEWFIGKTCGYEGRDDSGAMDEKLEMLNHFSIYFNYCEVQMATADEVENCWQNTPAPTQATTNKGDWVIPTSGECLSGYGPRWGAQHAGIDISPPQGTPIIAPTSMRITHVGDKGDGYGTSVTATATDGTDYSFRFAHMVAGSPSVQVGQEVSKGDTIGQVGSTGDSTGPHLHFEIFPPGANPASYSGAVDPVPVLAEHGVSVSCGGNS